MNLEVACRVDNSNLGVIVPIGSSSTRTKCVLPDEPAPGLPYAQEFTFHDVGSSSCGCYGFMFLQRHHQVSCKNNAGDKDLRMGFEVVNDDFWIYGSGERCEFRQRGHRHESSAWRPCLPFVFLSIFIQKTLQVYRPASVGESVVGFCCTGTQTPTNAEIARICARRDDHHGGQHRDPTCEAMRGSIIAPCLGFPECIHVSGSAHLCICPGGA